MNLIITTNYYQQENRDTQALYFLPQIPSDKIRDRVSVRGTTGTSHHNNHELGARRDHNYQCAWGGQQFWKRMCEVLEGLWGKESESTYNLTIRGLGREGPVAPEQSDPAAGQRPNRDRVALTSPEAESLWSPQSRKSIKDPDSARGRRAFETGFQRLGIKSRGMGMG